MKKIAVIGAGISGLAAAYELQKKGFEVVVFEKNSYVGGRMASRTKDSFPFDIGANHLANLYHVMKKYCKEFGIAWEPMAFLNYGVFRSGKIVPLSDIVKSVGGLRLLMQIPKKRKIPNFFNFNDAVEFDTDNAYDAMKKKAGQQIADYLVDPFTSAYQFHRANEISLGAFMAIFESIYHEQADWDLYHLKGEMSALPEAFAARLQNLRKEVDVTSVVASGDAGVEVTFLQNGSSQVQKEKFDAVILASTANNSLKIYKNPTTAQKELLEKVEYATTVGVAFKIPEKQLGDQSIVWVPYVESKYISGYTNERMKGADLVHDHKTLVCCWLHEDFAKSVIDKPDEEIFENIKPHLGDVCPLIKDTSLLENYDLQRWPQAMPKFSHGHLSRVKTFLDNHQGENNIFLCGDYLNSPWTEGSLQCGQKVAKLIEERG